jgi:hypothetical protein
MATWQEHNALVAQLHRDWAIICAITEVKRFDNEAEMTVDRAKGRP